MVVEGGKKENISRIDSHFDLIVKLQIEGHWNNCSEQFFCLEWTR